MGLGIEPNHNDAPKCSGPGQLRDDRRVAEPGATKLRHELVPIESGAWLRRFDLSTMSPGLHARLGPLDHRPSMAATFNCEKRAVLTCNPGSPGSACGMQVLESS